MFFQAKRQKEMSITPLCSLETMKQGNIDLFLV